ncbi:MAG: transposase [Corynebacterium casei]|nr:transposase [Corynebacterium casei]MDN6382862.1 transposase [Corynebacterium casei]
MPSKYTPELKQRAIELVLHAQASPDTARGAITRVAGELGLSKETLRVWVRTHKQSGTDTPAESVGLEAENRRLRAELAEAKRANDILKKASLDSTRECNTISAHRMKGRIRWPRSDDPAYPKINARKSGTCGKSVPLSAIYHATSVPHQDQSFPFSCPGEGSISRPKNTTQALSPWPSARKYPAA